MRYLSIVVRQSKTRMSQTIVPAAPSVEAGRIYSIEKAAAILGCDPNIILEYGGQGIISLFTYVPDGIVVCSTNTDVLKYHDPTCDPAWKFSSRDRVSGMEPIALSNVAYLKLSDSDCSIVRKQGVCRQAIYSSALHSNAEHELVAMKLPSLPSGMLNANFLRPNVWGEKMDYLFKRVACYAKGADFALHPEALKNIRLTESVLYIFGKDIRKLLETHNVRRKASAQSVPFNDGFVEQAYMSKRLIVLHRAALAFFNPNEKPSTKSTNTNIAAWIEQEYLKETSEPFGRRLAENLVKLIRSSYTNWDQAAVDERRAKGELSQFEIVVEVGEAWRQVDQNLRDELSQSLKDELVDVFSFSKDLAESVATLLRPEKTPSGGRPKNKK